MDFSDVGDLMVNFGSEALRLFPGRGSCMQPEREFGRHLGRTWQRDGHHVREEPFQCAPTAFLGFFPLLGVLYAAALCLYWSSPLATAAACALGLLLVVFESCLYWEAVDFAFPKRCGVNVVGVVAAASGQAPRQRVVVSAHQDAAYEFNLWWLFRHGGVPAMVLCLAGLAVPLAGAAVALLWPASVDDEDGWHAWLGLAAALLWPVQALNFMFHSGHVVPGAMDNLAGISVLTGLSHVLAQPGRGLRHTEVLLLGTSSEECGLRGAKRFAAAHRQHYRREQAAGGTRTRGIFVDGIYDERYLTIVTRELTTLAKHDDQLIQLADAAAKRLGLPATKAIIPFGASDASAFSVAGIPSVGLLCQDTSQLVHNYHTRDDLQHLVRPRSLTATLSIVYAMLQDIDQQ